MKVVLFVFLVYIILNLFVTKRINKSTYLSEDMRSLHKKFIWFLPFLGPIIIKNFWGKPKKDNIQTNTKTQRDKNAKYDGFYESGKGMEY
jgi:hypothetical protein